MKIARLVVDFLGIVVTVAGLILAVSKILPVDLASGTVFEEAQISTAKIVAPRGYSLVPAKLGLIEENTKFLASVDESMQLTRSAKVPFYVTNYGYNKERIRITMDGRYKPVLGVGDSYPVTGTDCVVWLYSIENDSDGNPSSGSFELRCKS